MAHVIVGGSEVHGLGVFATRDFATGEVVLRIDDSRVVDDGHPLRPALGERDYHCDYLADGKVVLMQSPERHINSSCDPNSYVATIDGVRSVVALRPIRCGEERSPTLYHQLPRGSRVAMLVRQPALPGDDRLEFL